ncbi:hypothetical protein GALMADRAFT_437595 [Galerina marginata CBS 339.88]|uniref:F-box domain-containing protein n=1 Tax=Galerina marginata (strain CBS 339.88) TaxID=685588 RepID=A0A067TBH9_GALM3|nr:hypothetical protein GALMADRAFT_437595 [Galerina marginata CBS 339.88]
MDLFPNLIWLAIPNIGNISFEHVPGLFLTPSSTLRSVTLDGITHSTEVFAASLIHSISIQAQELVLLSMAGQLSPTSLNLVNQFKTLDSLVITSRNAVFPGNTLQQFSGMPNLNSLHIHLREQSTFELPVIIPVFEQLQDLEISGSTSDILAIVQNIHPRNLKKIKIALLSLGKQGSQGCFGQCIQRISLLTRDTQTLKSIRIDSANADLYIPRMELKWLKLWTKVSQIDMTVDVLTSNTSSYFLSLGGEWSSIEGLTLRSGRTMPNGDALSISGLHGFLLVFPNLKRLKVSMSLRMDSAHVNSMRKALKNTTACHGLQELVLLPFKDSAIDFDAIVGEVCRAFIVARYIDHLCPHLKNLDLSRLGFILDSDWREGVEMMVKELQESRVRMSHHVCCNK